jgi:hypothetical protein
MDQVHINHWAVLVAALSDFAVGALWYSPVMFYKGWLAANRFTEADIKKGHPGRIYGLALLFALIISYNLAFFLAEPTTTVSWGLAAGALAGLWAVMGLWTIGQFERRSLAYLLINGGYLLVAFALKGLILGAWR